MKTLKWTDKGSFLEATLSGNRILRYHYTYDPDTRLEYGSFILSTPGLPQISTASDNDKDWAAIEAFWPREFWPSAIEFSPVMARQVPPIFFDFEDRRKEEITKDYLERLHHQKPKKRKH